MTWVQIAASFVTAIVGGICASTAYTWSAGIADVINKNVDGVQATAEETKGYVANIALMQGGELEASMATSLSAYEAWAGTGNYAGTSPARSWRGCPSRLLQCTSSR